MKNTLKKQLTTILSMMLVVAMSFALVACGKTEEPILEEAVVEEEVPFDPASDGTSEEIVEEVVDEEAIADEAAEAAAEETTEAEDVTLVATEVGEGATQFTFEVVDMDGNTTLFTVNTDKKAVGEALLDVDLIAGEDSEYGLYVKTVNGITADYDVDQTYWAFYIDGEYAMTGVDSTDVVAGSTYSFKVEK